jgi:3-(3-hydroxy-phenyl)propionate hydroxylase
LKDVIVIGCGPTGAVLALLLAKQGLHITVIERDEVFAVPRATHVDEETLRNFQLTGLINELLQYTQPFGTMQVLKNGKVLLQEEIIQPQAEHGYKGSRFFDQPEFEHTMRAALQTMPNVELIIGEEAKAITQEGVLVTVTTNKNSYTATYAVGCDGGRSMVRQQLNISMQALEPARDWIIVDSILKDTKDSILLPDKFCYYLEKERLTINAHGFGHHRRWEFQLQPGEAQPADDKVKQWVANYINLDKIDITRIAKYAHNSLVAERWQVGNIFLAGDAAHMMPPSAGQGLCSGVRDAVNLAWKLGDVIKGTAAPTLLNTYEPERKTHLYQILKRTLFFGRQLNGDAALQRVIRNIRLRVIEGLPALKAFLLNKFNTPTRLVVADNNHLLCGQHLPQFGNSDDTIGYRHALIAKTNCLTPTEISEASAKDWAIVQGIYDEWLTKTGVSKITVRPDKIIATVHYQ